jgi:hypothetical protein
MRCHHFSLILRSVVASLIKSSPTVKKLISCVENFCARMSPIGAGLVSLGSLCRSSKGSAGPVTLGGACVGASTGAGRVTLGGACVVASTGAGLVTFGSACSEASDGASLAASDDRSALTANLGSGGSGRVSAQSRAFSSAPGSGITCLPMPR